MWYEHGQSDTIINLQAFAVIQNRGDSIVLKAADHSIKILEYDDETEACEAYQIIRSKLINIPLYIGGQ